MKIFQIIMPVFQTKSIFLLCIQSLFKYINHPTELIIVNDGSKFNCIHEIFENFDVPDLIQLQYIEHPTSIGCPKSLNEGLRHIKNNAYVIFFDSDVIFDSEWQNVVINALEDRNIGGVSGIFLYPQSRGIQCCGISYQNYLAKHIYLNNHFEDLSLDEAFEVQASIFAFFATRSEVIRETGILDENFFNGYEDIDYQFRIRKSGYRIITNTAIKLYHFEKSNGIHRQYSRKQNLGYFWTKHGEYVKNDFYFYLERQLKIHNISNKKYIVVNMCEAKNDAGKTIEFLKRKSLVEEIFDVSNFCSIDNKIWLPEILNIDSYALPKPYIFLCDNFVELTENSYWYQLRSKYHIEDMIIDLYANIIPFKMLSNGFWPGNKIR